MLNDPEYAEVIASQDEPTEPWAPRIADWNLTTTLLSQLLSAVGGVQAAVVASAGGTPKPVKPFPVPRTEVENVKARQDKAASAMILRMAGFDPDDYV